MLEECYINMESLSLFVLWEKLRGVERRASLDSENYSPSRNANILPILNVE